MGARGGRGLSVRAAMAARPGGDGAGAARPGPGVRRRLAWYQRYQRRQLEELQRKIRGLEGDNRQLREQLQHSQARVEELEGQVSSLRTELQQSREERSRWQREAEAQAAEWQQLEAELQQWHQELQELWESARYREEQLGAAQKLNHNAEEDYGLHLHDHQRDRDDPLATVRAVAEYTKMCCVILKSPRYKKGPWRG
ncbi:uncharacterized protein [Anas platyrhynchos]|uniref:uncharacterized protein isoform X4 n=1 Tax=Anas platyrhynchos TaxID=8839 RepID=UPI003AF2FD26